MTQIRLKFPHTYLEINVKILYCSHLFALFFSLPMDYHSLMVQNEEEGESRREGKKIVRHIEL